MGFKNLFAIVFTLATLQVFSQQSIISGTVIDDATGEALIGVAVVIEGTTIGSATNLEGQFQIKANPGTYNLKASFISFSLVVINDVVVNEGEPTIVGSIRLKSAAELLKAVEITAKAVKNTEAALVTMKRKSANVIDGVSSAGFKKVGDSDAASAMSRVTGVSVQGGKYVYVRGLGDRYTKTTLNGMSVPGLDPDRNTVQMDIFPTNIIDNIVVSKSFSAELPADFTGGAVNIDLKDFPEKKEMSIGVGLGYNPGMHFNDNYITYSGSGTDFLGFDGGARDIPTGGGDDVPQYGDVIGSTNSAAGQNYINTLQGFDKQMAGYRSTSFMNTSLNFSLANQISTRSDYSLGYIFALNYQNDVEYYEGAENNLYGKSPNSDEYELTALQIQKGDYGVRNVLTSAMAGVAIKKDNVKYKLNVVHLQNGESKAGIFDYTDSNVGTTFQAKQYNLDYSERGLTNVLLSGKHMFDANDLELEWKVSPTRSTISDPDVRFTRFRILDGEIDPRISTEVGLPQRIWRNLEEYNVASNLAFTKKYQLFDEDAKLKFGGNYTYKTRDFGIQSFQIDPGNVTFDSGNPNDIFNDENLFSSDNIAGVHHNPLFAPRNSNEYKASVGHAAVYGSNEFNPTPLLKAIIGVRVEKYDQTYTGVNQSGSIVLDNEKVLDDLNLFPAANLIYSLTEKQNLRFSYSNTIARPSFKELSYAEIVDPITGRTFVGGLFGEQSIDNGDTTVLWDGNLQSTKITNLDLRWELFQGIGQNVSVGAFYKRFDSPIEIVQYLSAPGTFQARNVGDATVLGAEFELIQNLSIINEKFKAFTFNTNVTVVHSSITLSNSELKSRQNNAKDGEEVSDTREMAGQAPYIINTGLSYKNVEKKVTANVSYNIQGRTLEFVGFGNRANVYSVPFHNLSMKVGKSFGEDDKMNMSFKVSNIFNDEKEKVFSSYQASDQIFSRLRPQRTFSISFSYKL